MRTTVVAGIAMVAVVLAGGGCSQPADSSPEFSSSAIPDVSAAASPSSSPEASEAPASGVAITFDKVKSKRWGAKPFKVKAVASSGAKVKYTAKGSCTIRPNSGLVEIQDAGDCVITARTTEGEPGEASKTIHVNPAKPKLQFAGKSVRFQRPFSYTLKAKVSPKIPLTFTLVDAGSGPECKVSNGKLTLTQRKPSLEADCKVKVAASKTSPNYETPKPVVATIHIRYPSWDVDAISPEEVDYSADGDEVRVTVFEHSGDALGIDIGQADGTGNCDVVGISPDRAPPGTTKYIVTLRAPDPGLNGTPQGYDCGMRASALPPDWSCCVAGTKSDEFTVTVVP